MKKLITLSVFSLFVTLLPAQEYKELMHISLSTGEVVTYNVTEINSIHFEVLAAEDKVPEFPAGDNSVRLNPYDPQTTAASLLTSAGTACTNTMGKIVITTDEYNEIKKFTDGKEKVFVPDPEGMKKFEKAYETYRKLAYAINSIEQ